MAPKTVEIDQKTANELLKNHLPKGVTRISVTSAIHTGYSGATVWEVDVESQGNFPGGLAIAKFDEYERCEREQTRTDEAQLNSIIEKYSPKPLTTPPPPKLNIQVGDKSYPMGFLLSRKARDAKAQRIDTLQTVIDQNKRNRRQLIVRQVELLIDTIYRDWYAPLAGTTERETVDLLDTFKQLLNIDSDTDRVDRLDERLRAAFALPSDKPYLILRSADDTKQLPNPSYFLRRPDIWAPALRAIRTPITPMHGDLHAGNIICQVTRNGTRPIGVTPWLIDFANYEAEGLPFYDLVHLEFDVLKQYLSVESRDQWRDWADLVPYLTGGDLHPTDQPTGERAIFAWELIAPIRRFAHALIAEVGKRQSEIDDELRRMWWLAMVAVGMRAAQREGAPQPIRSAGLIYAAHALEQLEAPDIADGEAVVLDWHGDYGLNAAPPNRRPIKVEPAPTTRRLYTPHQYHPPTHFVGRVSELAELDQWAQSRDRVLEVIAIGGQGKSALTWEWFNQHAQQTIPDFAGGLWWSFYESDGAMSRFISTALREFGDQSPDEIDKLSREEREDAVIALCREKAVLFVFDGLERILNAYRILRAATQTDDEVDLKVENEAESGAEHPRACANAQDGALLKRLVAAGAARILISTRLPVRDLEDKFGKELDPVARLELHGLSDADVLALFAYYDVTGDHYQMIDFAHSFGSHGLLLTLIIGKIREFRRARGDFDQWYAREGRKLNLRELDIRQQRTHILQFALAAISDDARALLRRLAVFNYPFDFDAAMMIHPFIGRYYVAPELPAPPFSAEEYERKQAEEKQARQDYMAAPSGSPEEAEANARRDALRAELASYRIWQADCSRRENEERQRAHQSAEEDVDRALYELEDRGLITYDFGHHIWDMHPVVRGYAYNDLGDDPAGRAEALAGKRNYFEARETTPPDQIKDMDDLRRELEIYDALVQAGDFDRASEFYGDKLRNILHFQLNAHHEIVRLLTPLFRNGIDQPPALASRSAQQARITDLANAYFYIDEQQATRLRALNIQLRLEDRSSANLLVDIWAFSINLSDQNRYGSAIHALRLGLRLAQARENRGEIAMMQRLLFQHYVKVGQWDEAEAAYAAVDIADFKDNERALWEGEMTCYAAEMRIARGQDATTLLDDAERLARKARNGINLRYVEQLRGEYTLLRRDGRAAARHFETYLEMQQRVRMNVYGARGGLARALLLQGKPDLARAQLESGTDDLSAAEVWLALSENERAEKAALAAYKEL